MKNLKIKNSIAALLLLVVSSVPATPQKGVDMPMVIQCFDYDGGPALKDGFGEIPFVEGDGDINLGNDKSAPIKFTLYVNPDSRSWTIMYNLGDLHCVAGGGEGSFRPAGLPEEGVKM